jgi:hypothetical protein
MDKCNLPTDESALLELSGLYFFTLQRSGFAGGLVQNSSVTNNKFVFTSTLEEEAHCVEYSPPYILCSSLQQLVLPETT